MKWWKMLSNIVQSPKWRLQKKNCITNSPKPRYPLFAIINDKKKHNKSTTIFDIFARKMTEMIKQSSTNSLYFSLNWLTINQPIIAALVTYVFIRAFCWLCAITVFLKVQQTK